MLNDSTKYTKIELESERDHSIFFLLSLLSLLLFSTARQVKGEDPCSALCSPLFPTQSPHHSVLLLGKFSHLYSFVTSYMENTAFRFLRHKILIDRIILGLILISVG